MGHLHFWMATIPWTCPVCPVDILSNLWGIVRDAPDTFNFLRHVMRAIWSVRPKCSHRCVTLKETPLKPVQIHKHTTFYSAEQTAMRTKWFKHITIQEHLLNCTEIRSGCPGARPEAFPGTLLGMPTTRFLSELQTHHRICTALFG